MTRTHRSAALLGTVLMMAAGCGHSVSPSASSPPPPPPVAAASSSSGQGSTVPAPPAFDPVLPLLRPATMPVYLPAWLPALPAGESYYFTGKADAGTYTVGIAMSRQPAAADSLPDLPEADQVATVMGGQPGHLGPDPRLDAPATPGQSVDVAPGVAGAYYPQPPGGDFSLLQWRVGGWTFQVADVTGLGAPAKRLLPYAQALMADVTQGAGPVPGVPAGAVVETLAPDGAPTWVLWQREGWGYRIETHNAPAVRMAGSMVHVATQAGGGAPPRE